MISTKDFLTKANQVELPSEASIEVKCPSNIALVKYWGKKPIQIPKNPSISFTLDKAYTQTKLSIEKTNSEPKIEVYLSGKLQESFVPKIQKWIKILGTLGIKNLDQYDLKIETENSFPHGAGIASSAAGFGALGLALANLLSEHSSEAIDTNELASFLARVGSGSACRSIYGGLVEWGIESDEFAKPLSDFHEVFQDYQDCILIVEEGEKSVSSTVGHALMDNHDYGEIRIERANKNIAELTEVLKSGDLEEFIKIVESEALDLHAMMMTSTPNFMLFEPDTIAILKKIVDFRKKSGFPIGFTLDAGANVHVLFPKRIYSEAMNFIDSELKPHYSYYICDRVGTGPTVLNTANEKEQ